MIKWILVTTQQKHKLNQFKNNFGTFFFFPKEALSIIIPAESFVMLYISPHELSTIFHEVHFMIDLLLLIKNAWVFPY